MSLPSPSLSRLWVLCTFWRGLGRGNWEVSPRKHPPHDEANPAGACLSRAGTSRNVAPPGGKHAPSETATQLLLITRRPKSMESQKCHYSM